MLKPERRGADSTAMDPMTIIGRALRRAATQPGGLGVLACAGAIGFLPLVAPGADGPLLQLRIVLGVALAIAGFVAAASVVRVPAHVPLDAVIMRARQDLAPGMARVAVSLAPLGIVLGLVALLAGPVPGLALLLVPIVLAVAAASTAPALLAATRVGEEIPWLPRAAWIAARRRPWVTCGTGIVVAIVAALAVIPLAFFGIVFLAVAGWFGAFGLAVACAAATMPLACAAVALADEAFGADLEFAASMAPAVGDRVGASGGAQAGARAGAGRWRPGPSWSVELRPGEPWGTWMRLDSAGEVAIALTCTAPSVPRLDVASADGQWRTPTQPVPNGPPVVLAFEAGDTYLQLTATHALPHAVQLTLQVAALGDTGTSAA